MIKKSKIFLLIGIFLVTGIKSVNAETCENLSNVYATTSNFINKSEIHLDYGGNSPYNYTMYYLTQNGQNYIAYCRNAGQSATSPSVSEDDQLMSCQETVFDSTKKVNTTIEKAKMAYDKGIAYILKNGYNTETSEKEGYESYVSANVALRAYELLWLKFDSNNYTFDANLRHAMEYFANLLMDDYNIKMRQKEIDNELGDNVYTRKTMFPNASTKGDWGYSSGTKDEKLTNDINAKIKELVVSALDEAINYLENGAASISWNKTPIKTTIETEEKVTYTHTYQFDIKKFNSDAKIEITNFECDYCSIKGINYTFKVNGKNYDNINSLDILGLDSISNGTGKVTINVIFEVTNEKKEQLIQQGSRLDYKLNISYKDDTIITEAYVMQDSNCPTCQKFYMLYAENQTKTDSISNYLDFNSKITENCTAYIKNADCDTEDDNDIYVSEGYKIDSTSSSACNNVSKENNENILGCVIGGSDVADNSYLATDLVNNNYCSVFCKEDYHFTLPGVQEANSGRYFSLKATVKGTKTCYMAKKVDYEKFINSELEEAREKVIVAWNEWNLYYNAVNNHSSNLISNPKSGAKHNPHYYNCDSCPKEGTCPPKSSRCDYCSGDVARDYYGYKYTWEFEAYNQYGYALTNASSLSKESNTTCEYNGGKIKCTYSSLGKTWCYHGNCDSEDGKDISTYYNSTTLSKREIELNKAIENYRNLINAYNTCSGQTVIKYTDNKLTKKDNQAGWTMTYNYNPTIAFSYEESYNTYAVKRTLDTVGNINFSNITEKFYSADISDKYITDEYEQKKQFVCFSTGNGYTCDKLDISISKANYIKQEINVTGSYITPTQFYTIYPTGAIVTADSNNEKDIENSSELTNALPVGLGTKKGVYNYTLQISDLGEFYDKPGTLGRIWGAENSVVSTVLDEAENKKSCSQTGALTSNTILNNSLYTDGVYVCAYKVNCPDCDIECDPVCKNPCPNGECPVECDPPCIIDNGKNNFNYKPISPGDINPSDRELGVNWSWGNISTEMELKAYVTTSEIEENGENIYDINYEDTSQNTGFSMTVTLDSNLINKIRKYNEEHEDEGYVNNTLACYDYKVGNTTYDNIFCYSTFIDEMIKETGGPNTNGGSNNFKISGERYYTESDRKNKYEGYWTTWALANVNGKYLTTTQIGFNYSEVGPSWK